MDNKAIVNNIVDLNGASLTTIDNTQLNMFRDSAKATPSIPFIYITFNAYYYVDAIAIKTKNGIPGLAKISVELDNITRDFPIQALNSSTDLSSLIFGASPLGTWGPHVSDDLIVLWFPNVYNLEDQGTSITDYKTTMANITFLDQNDNSLGLDVERIFVGRHFMPAYNLTRGHSFSQEDDSSSFRTESGRRIAVSSNIYRTFSFELSVASESDRRAFVDLYKFCGKGRPVVASLFPSDPNTYKNKDYLFLGYFTESPKIKELYNGFYKITVKMEEA